MRKIFFIPFLIFCMGSRAQVELNVNIGINNTQLHTTSVPAGFKTAGTNNWQWQSGISFIFPVEKNGFFYTGIQYENKIFHETVFVCCAIYRDADFHLHNISIPAGAGYRLPVSKNTSLQFSGGMYLSMATGGYIAGIESSGDFPIPNGPYIDPHFKRNLSFSGDDIDLKRWNYGLEAGISANWKKIRLQFQYQLGLSESAPENAYHQFKYRTASLDLGYRIFTFKK